MRKHAKVAGHFRTLPPTPTPTRHQPTPASHTHTHTHIVIGIRTHTLAPVDAPARSSLLPMSESTKMLMANEGGASFDFVDCSYSVKVCTHRASSRTPTPRPYLLCVRHVHTACPLRSTACAHCVPHPPRRVASCPCTALLTSRRFQVPLDGSMFAKTDKVLISDCSASVPPGSVLALMGPSGAGKTTLLNELTLAKVGGTPTGTVTLAGHIFDMKCYQSYAAVVQQVDLLWPFLTAREHIVYATALYQSQMDAEHQAKWVDGLLLEVGLVDCQHVKAGNELFKGLSGGQRRRLSLAVALCKKPHVVFLDEPTSGLDAASAASIMAFLKETAARMNVSVICTIHQPSTSVFAGFDNVAFLTGGKFAYLGKAAQLSQYLTSIGKPVIELR